MPLYSSYGSSYGGGSMYDCPIGGGYDLGGVWRPHTGRHEWVADRYYPGEMGVYPHAYGDMSYDHALHHNHYRSPMDYYGSYNSLAMYEEQLRLMEGISEAERRARWQARIQFEELCEEERAMRYALMAEEERMRLGLHDSHWGARYGGGGYSHPMHYSAHLSPWGSGRMPLSGSLMTRFNPGMGGYGLGYPGGMYGAGSVYGAGSAYGVGNPQDILRNRALIKAQIAEARRLRRHARENHRQACRMMITS